MDAEATCPLAACCTSGQVRPHACAPARSQAGSWALAHGPRCHQPCEAWNPSSSAPARRSSHRTGFRTCSPGRGDLSRERTASVRGPRRVAAAHGGPAPSPRGRERKSSASICW
jgi:hypothetical protein